MIVGLVGVLLTLAMLSTRRRTDVTYQQRRSDLHRARPARPTRLTLRGKTNPIIILGVVLVLIGFIAKVTIIWTLGVIAIVVGAVLALVGFAGHEIGGRRHYF